MNWKHSVFKELGIGLGYQVILYNLAGVGTKCLGSPEKREMNWNGMCQERLHRRNICTSCQKMSKNLKGMTGEKKIGEKIEGTI